jgi:RNA recognition motif-containing protein
LTFFLWPFAFVLDVGSRITKKKKERKDKEKSDKKVPERSLSAGTVAASSTVPAVPSAVVRSNSTSSVDRRHLHNYRVVQRNLVYVIGVPASIALEETLRKPEYFGQYGKIGKVVIHRNHSVAHASVSAYVTFTYKDDARTCIQSLEGYWIEGHLLRASFGTTKYCNNFIRGVACNNPDCVYLHELGDDDDRFTKEEIQVSASGTQCLLFKPVCSQVT